jgi:xylulose-5-phosphate/fructose-6-phosphate phosphoketolase
VPVGAETLVEHCKGMLRKHQGYVVEHLEDMPEVRDWTWPG